MPKITAATVVEHRERTNEALQDAALALVLERGYESVTMRAIAERAGVRRTAVYNYAPDKLALLLGGAQRQSAELRAMIAAIAEGGDASAADRIRSLIRVLFVTFTNGAQHLFLLRTVDFSLSEAQRERVETRFHDDVGASLRRIVSDGMGSGEFASLDVDRAIRLVVGVVEAALNEVAHDPGMAAEIADVAARFVVNGLRPGVE